MDRICQSNYERNSTETRRSNKVEPNRRWINACSSNARCEIHGEIGHENEYKQLVCARKKRFNFDIGCARKNVCSVSRHEKSSSDVRDKVEACVSYLFVVLDFICQLLLISESLIGVVKLLHRRVHCRLILNSLRYSGAHEKKTESFTNRQ